MYLRILFLSLFILFYENLSAQEVDSTISIIVLPSSKPARITWLNHGFVPKPKTALILSIVPGAGQAYNHDWWKIPIVYGAIGGMGYLTYFNYNEYARYRDARVSFLGGNQIPEFPGATEQSLRANRDFYRKNFEASAVGLGLIYILQAVEAYTAAHLSSFDINDDLSLNLFQEQSYTNSYSGLKMVVRLN